MSRLFVIDPVCAMEYGHTLNALAYFADMASGYCGQVYKVASYHLPAGLGQDIERYFDFQYDWALKIKRSQDMVRPGPRATDGEGISSLEYYRFLEDHAITADDTLMFPGIDFYSIVGVLNALRGLPRERVPRLMIRFIGVLEQGARHLAAADALAFVTERLREAIAAQTPMALCAETPKYARRLSLLLDTEVLTVPYFAPGCDPLPMPSNGPTTFLLGGSARADKGFLRLGTIIQRANQLVDPRKMHFIVQGPPDELYVAHSRYVASLHAQPNVTLLASTLPYSEIVASFRRSHVALMPYDPGTYEWRGSAMLMEAIMFNRQVICQAGTAFAEQARTYGAGEVCGTDADFSDAIGALSERDPGTIAAFATIARKQYLTEVKQSCSAWFQKAAA
jgi:hypothetical protein